MSETLNPTNFMIEPKLFVKNFGISKNDFWIKQV